MRAIEGTTIVSNLIKDRIIDRPAMGVKLGCGFAHACDPKIDLNDGRTARAGAMYRNARKMPSGSYLETEAMRNFVRITASREFTKVERVYTFEEWLEKTNYPEWRKVELKAAKERTMGLTLLEWVKEYREFIVKVQCFIKEEHYGDFKHARGIYARMDEFKVLYGPYVRSMEDVVYKHPSFIKHIPVRDRAEYISSYFEGISHFACSDYESFESTTTVHAYKNVLLPVYEHLLKHLPGWCDFLELFNVLRDTNHFVFKWFHMWVSAKRCSGEMDTSLGNGLLNFMILHFMAMKEKWKGFKCIVEGDDAIFTFDGCGCRYVFPDFTKYGVYVKAEMHSDIGMASFCGLIFSESMQCIADPLRHISRMTSKEKYTQARKSVHMRLARMKAMCLLYQYPASPVLAKYCEYVLRVTKGMDVSSLINQEDTYKRDLLWEAESFIRKSQSYWAEEPTIETRLLCERYYGISVEHQIRWEKEFESLTEYQEVWPEGIEHYLHPSTILYNLNYTANIPRGSRISPVIPSGPNRWKLASIGVKKLTKPRRT